MITLASQSVRRRQILKKMGIRFRVISSPYHERKLPGLSPRELVIHHAVQKAKRAKSVKRGVVLGADTLVFLGRKILGKPKSRREAVRMLKMLSGKPHFVYTGIALLLRPENKILAGFSKTKVEFKKLSPREIEAYFSRVNPLDKAGAYAIQEGPRIVKKIYGSYSNVVGLPRELVKNLLKQADIG